MNSIFIVTRKTKMNICYHAVELQHEEDKLEVFDWCSILTNLSI